MRSTDNVSAFQKRKSSGKQATIALIFRFKFLQCINSLPPNEGSRVSNMSTRQHNTKALKQFSLCLYPPGPDERLKTAALNHSLQEDVGVGGYLERPRRMSKSYVHCGMALIYY